MGPWGSLTLLRVNIGETGQRALVRTLGGEAVVPAGSTVSSWKTCELEMTHPGTLESD